MAVSPYATRFKEYFSRYMGLDPAVYVGGSVKNPAHKIAEFINEKGERQDRILEDHEKEAYISVRINQVINGDFGQLSRLFDQIAIPYEDMASEFLQAEEAKKNGTLEEHLTSVVLQASEPFLEPDRKKLNTVAINAIGVENYQKIVTNYLQSHSGDEVATAEKFIADKFIQAIAVTYPQKLVEYNHKINSHNVEEYLRKYNHIISPMQSYTGKITGATLSQPAVKKLSITELLPLFDTLEKKSRETLNSLKEYKNLYPKDEIPKALAEAVKLAQIKVDEIDTIHSFRDEGLPVEDKIQVLLQGTHDQKIQTLFEKFQIEEYINQTISSIVEYHMHLVDTNNAFCNELEPIIQKDLSTLINLKGNIESLSKLEEELRKLPMVSLVQYHQAHKANMNNEEMKEIINGKIAGILLARESILSEVEENRTNQSDFRALNSAQRAQADAQEDREAELDSGIKLK